MFDLLQRIDVIAYDGKEQQRITSLLNGAVVMPKRVDLMCYPTDDFWVRKGMGIEGITKSGRSPQSKAAFSDRQMVRHCILALSCSADRYH